MKPQGKDIHQFRVCYHQYADDTHLYMLILKCATAAVDVLPLLAVPVWMKRNRQAESQQDQVAVDIGVPWFEGVPIFSNHLGRELHFPIQDRYIIWVLAWSHTSYLKNSARIHLVYQLCLFMDWSTLG